MLIQYADQTVNGKQAVVRNGYLPERSIQTGLGEVPVKVPKVRDRSGGGIKFNSKRVPSAERILAVGACPAPALAYMVDGS